MGTPHPFSLRALRVSVVHFKTGNVWDVPIFPKKLVAGNGSVTKREVARIVCSRFPELRVYLDTRQTQTKQKYWQNLFDAVAIALSAVALTR